MADFLEDIVAAEGFCCKNLLKLQKACFGLRSLSIPLLDRDPFQLCSVQ